MAVTSIWPIKGRVDKVINYARNPEKTVEAVHNDLAQLHTIDGVVEYAADEMKTSRSSIHGVLRNIIRSAMKFSVSVKRIPFGKNCWIRPIGSIIRKGGVRGWKLQAQ